MNNNIFKLNISRVQLVFSIVFLSLCLFVGSSFAQRSTTKKYIGTDRAKAIALEHAKVSAANANFLKVSLDYENGREVYDVEFLSGDSEYDYEIDAFTGKIIEYGRDIKNYERPKTDRKYSLQFDKNFKPSVVKSGDKGNHIGMDRAESIALQHAGVTRVNANILKSALDYENGRDVYEIEFISASTEYDYEIDAVTGNIIKFDNELEKYNAKSDVKNLGNKTRYNNSRRDSSRYIGEEKAKAIAVKHAGVSANNVRYTKTSLDRDDGIEKYEIEFRHGRNEYEYEVDAITGKIIKFDSEVGKYSSKNVRDNKSYIGEEKAKAIAIKHAGVPANSVKYTKVSLDKDDGAEKYEIEFRYGKTEYEYEIDAVTGKIINFEKDYKRR